MDMSDEILLFLVKKIPSCVDVFRLSETCTRMARDVEPDRPTRKLKC